MSGPYDLHCVDVVGNASAYANGRLEPERRGRLEEHVATCAGCFAYLDQFTDTLRLLSRRAEAPSEQRRRELERLLLGETPEA
jgi:anti-sigma factor RsiW